MKDGDFVTIEFTGRTKDTNDVFDTTNGEAAILAGIYNPKANYGSVPVIVGANQVIPGMDEAIREMNVGEKKTIELTSEKAFGERKTELVTLVPMSTFKESNMEPALGRTVNVRGMEGKIVSVDGGRVKIDFNHPLAGRTIEYEIEIKSELKETIEKVQGIVRYFTGLKMEDSNPVINDSEVSISIQKADFPKAVKKNIADTIMKWMNMTKVSFLDVFEKEN
ncbi:MAG: peptidylprolyl isomerase [Candidatus Aenigmarchaeota archaeon]|nr:peptidylprolyl isomerase [Candidatus Aenigmarchaeota archaeon]